MIPLIHGISDNDSSRYYAEGLVFHNGAPYIFCEREGDNVRITNGSTKRVPYSELMVTVLPPFYDARGAYHGHQAGRRTSRSISYPLNTFGDIMELIRTGDVPRTEGKDFRLNKDWFVGTLRHLQVLYYKGELVGFLRDSTFYVNDPLIADRLQQLILEKAYEFLVRSSRS